MSSVYHYTDTARLPWILQSGELRPGSNRIGGFPDPDFLWATTSPLGDRSASASMPALRAGLVRAVRFVLSAADFEPWRDAVVSMPAWTPEQVSRLERAAQGHSSPRDWRVRAQPLPKQQWLGIETRSYVDRTWRPITKPDQKALLLEPTVAAVATGSDVFISEKTTGPYGADAYIPTLARRAA